MSREKKVIVLLIIVLLISAIFIYATYTPGNVEVPKKPNPIAVVNTTYGVFKIELYEDKVKPLTDHFIRYVESDFYDGLIFHMLRVSTKEMPNGTLVPYNGNMVMTGAYYPNFTKKKPTFILNWNKRTDVIAGLKHTDLSVSWIDDSYGKVGSRWYVCNGDFSGRAFQMDEMDPVFGKVISGANVIRKIGNLSVYDVNNTDPQLSRVPMGPNNTTVKIIHIYVYRPKTKNEAIFLMEAPESAGIQAISNNLNFFPRPQKGMILNKGTYFNP